MNDHRDDPARGRQPQWPGGDNPGQGGYRPPGNPGDGAAPGGPPGGGPNGGPPPARRPARRPGRPGNPPQGGQPGGQQGGPGGPVQGGQQGPPPGGPGTPPRGNPQQPGNPQQGGQPGQPGGPNIPVRGNQQPGNQQPGNQQPGGPPPGNQPGGQPPRGNNMPGNPPRPPNRGSAGAGPPIRPDGLPPGGRPAGRPGGRPMPGEVPTDHLPPVDVPDYVREPALLTHRDDDLEPPPPPSGGGGGGGGGYDDEPPDGERSEEDGLRRKKRRWRRVRRTVYVLVGLGIVAPIAAFFVMYQTVTVPDPAALAQKLNQPVSIYYSDGSLMTTLTAGTQGVIQPAQIPDSVRHAVEAAEDETFETNSGFDMKAILRTVYNQVSGGEGGASTITQEYIKQATGNDQHSLSRKASEVVEAYKMTNTYPDKSQILASYLNIVYFGRGANGITSAAKVYFNENVSQLTDSQAALLAGLIQLPGYANDVAYEHKRWTYVMGRMAFNKWLKPGEQQTATFPTPIPDGSNDQTPLPWDRQLIEKQILAELTAKGWSQSDLERQGAKIYTTIQPVAQTDAENSVAKVMAKDTKFTSGGTVTVGKTTIKGTEAAALVSIDPTTGGVIAYFGGNDPKATEYDLADTAQQPGSSFKPYVFASGLQNDPSQIGLNSVWDGTDNQVLDGQHVHNSEGESCAQCNVKTAMTESINTVFYGMGVQIGTNNVRNTAFQVGIPQQETVAGVTAPSLIALDPTTHKPGNVEGGISIGQYPVRPIDQAQGYATLANMGNYIPAHFVTKVTDSSGSTLYTANTTSKPAFSSDPETSQRIAHTVIDSMTDVAASSGDPLAGGRPNAAKTGTQDFKDAKNPSDTGHDADAWMVGFTPQVVTSVWFGHYDAPAPIFGNYRNTKGASHDYDVYGREEPAAIWQDYMNTFLAKTKVAKFPSVPDIGGAYNFVTKQDTGLPSDPVTTTTPPPATTTPNLPVQPSQTTATPPTTTPQDPVPPTTTDSPPCGVFGCGGTGGGGGGTGGGGRQKPGPGSG